IGDRVVLLTARPHPKGGVVLVLHDLSELKRLETVRRDFVANVSHELKTPLTSISGYADTLLADDLDPTTRRKFLNVILSNSRRMQRLVDDLLDLARLDAGRWQPSARSLEVRQLAQDAWAPLAQRASERGVTLEVTGRDASTVYVDPYAIRQILTNLFDNSLRHTPPGGRITVTSTANGGGVELSVRDTGSGIAPEHLPRIFERFYRVDSGRARDE